MSLIIYSLCAAFAATIVMAAARSWTVYDQARINAQIRAVHSRIRRERRRRLWRDAIAKPEPEPEPTDQCKPS